ncbi:MAG: hypothetical protein Q9165_008708 [Trypethelium subeluteriae]
MAPFAANYSCDPFTARSAQCVVGTYVQYAVNVSSIFNIQKTLDFTQQRNLRLVVRNTGHDYFGKSTGAGTVAIWTHFLKNITVHDWTSASYSGKALTIGTGISAGEAQQAAHDAGLVVVGGNSPTVGLAGGYTQGGGHGPLASHLSLGADQVLQWEVVASSGLFLSASPEKNADLYWALAGGGGGTYGIVWSVAVKAYPDFSVAAANLTFSNANVSQDVFYRAVQTFIQSVPAIVDTGAVSIWLLTNTTFLLQPITAPLQTAIKVQALLAPTLRVLNASGISYEYYVGGFPNYLASYEAMNPQPLIAEYSIGGRLLPRSLVKDQNSAKQLMAALESIAGAGGVISGLSVNVSRFGIEPPNSVNPIWRDALFDAVVGAPWLENDPTEDYAGQRAVTDQFLPALEKLTPAAGAYLNEGDINQPDFQNVFYNRNYDRLKSIKDKYDPLHTFYGLTSVGSEFWQQQPDGRLCRAPLLQQRLVAGGG